MFQKNHIDVFSQQSSDSEDKLEKVFFRIRTIYKLIDFSEKSVWFRPDNSSKKCISACNSNPCFRF